MRKNTPESFWKKVDIKSKKDCWEWKGRKTKGGYGHFCMKLHKTTAHRYAYMLSKGKIRKGFYVLHSCDNPSCCNPEHLWLGTQKQNIADMFKKGRQGDCRLFGEKHGRCKLTFAQCQEIKTLYKKGNISQQRLADIYKIRQSHISRIIRGENRKES